MLDESLGAFGLAGAELDLALLAELLLLTLELLLALEGREVEGPILLAIFTSPFHVFFSLVVCAGCMVEAEMNRVLQMFPV